jgi:aminoglycoside phosphotransferase (APT) family kinase protein
VQKSDITVDVVSCLIAQQFPQWSDLAIRPVDVDGWDNTTFRLGDELSVRLPSADGYVPQVEKEHRWLPVLAPHLPLAIPIPVALGRPGCGFPRPWSVNRWIAGERVASDQINDTVAFAEKLAAFLVALRRVDTADGPAAGAQSFHRGGPLRIYDCDIEPALATLGDRVEADAIRRVWADACSTEWAKAPVWVHGDVAASNLLMRNGELVAVIDFGTCAIGDPACDLVIAWTLFDGESRKRFVEAGALDVDTWSRARGWALWKALITWAEAVQTRVDPAVATHRFGWRCEPDVMVWELLTEAM